MWHVYNKQVEKVVQKRKQELPVGTFFGSWSFGLCLRMGRRGVCNLRISLLMAKLHVKNGTQIMYRNIKRNIDKWVGWLELLIAA